MLLKEVRVLTDLQVISESRETGVMCIRGTFQRAEEANHNQRIYPRAVLENCVKNLSEKLSGRELVGELDHPADGVVKLQNASHLITKLEWKGNDLIGEAEILPTPAGQIAKSLINAGVKIGISSRGMGTLSESVKGPKIVNDDYKMITFDLVADPSTKGAYPSLAESRQHAIDFVENVIKPAISEKAFVARLKKALNESRSDKNDDSVNLIEGLARMERQLKSKKISEKDKKNIRRKYEAKKKTSARRGDQWRAEGQDPQYESRRDAARAKLEEMCGPKKHGKKKLTKESGLNPITLNYIYENYHVEELTLSEWKFFGLRGGRHSDAAIRRQQTLSRMSARDAGDSNWRQRGGNPSVGITNREYGDPFTRMRARQRAQARQRLSGFSMKPKTSAPTSQPTSSDPRSMTPGRVPGNVRSNPVASSPATSTSSPTPTKKPRQGILPLKWKRQGTLSDPKPRQGTFGF